MISLSKMKDWFEQETENSGKKTRMELIKRIDMIKDSMQDLKLSAKDFEVSDTVDAESRSSQNIYEKMTEMVEEFTFPEKITYQTTDDFLKEVEKFLTRVLTLGRKFIPNLKKKYRTRVFILNRALTRVQKNYQDSKAFFEDKTDILKDVDNTSTDISILIDKVKEREDIKSKIKREETEAENLDKKIANLANSSTNLESGSVLQEYDDINKEIGIIGNKLKLELGGLDKPLRKLASRTQDGKINVPPHLIDFANTLKESPITAFENSAQRNQDLMDLMQILKQALEDDKIDVKAAMKNKAIALTEEIMKGSINSLLKDLDGFFEKRKLKEKTIDDLGLKEKILEIKSNQEELEKEKDRKRRLINDLKANLESLNDYIVELAVNTQRNVKALTNQDIKINIKE